MKKNLLSSALTILLFNLFSFSTQAQIQIGVDIDGVSTGNQLGKAVSMSDPYTIALGAPFSRGGNRQAGHVEVHRWDGTAWVQKGSNINGEGINFSDRSGWSVSLPDSNTVGIGAPQNDGNGSNSGHVRVYRWDGSNWVQKGIDIDGEAAGDQSGYSISMPDSNTIAIGAIENDGSGSNSGHVRIYTWNGTNWIKKGNDINGESAGDESGYAVSMPDANTVAIGSRENDGNGNNSGHARVYSWNGSAWQQKGIDIDGESANDQSGWSVSMPDSNTIAIGAPYNDGNGNASGHVRIYEWNGTLWQQKGQDINGESSGDLSGWSVSMPNRNNIAIGAPRNNNANADAGHARIYRWNHFNRWLKRLNDIDGEGYVDYSAESISMVDSFHIVIGAAGNESTFFGGGLDFGHARVYQLCPPNSVQTATACDSFTWAANGNIYTQSGKYTIPGSCQTLDLTIINRVRFNTTRTACVSYTWPRTGLTYSQSGQYSDSVLMPNGCEFIATLNLNIDTVNIAVTQAGPNLTAIQNGATYQWLDCNNSNLPIQGATSQNFLANANGSYAVEVRFNNCTDTSNCYNVIGVGLNDLTSTNNVFEIFPNPASTSITLKASEIVTNELVVIYDLTGRKIKQVKLSSSIELIDVSPFENGIYFVQYAGQMKKVVLKH